MARLPVSLYGAQAHLQRRAATLLHGMDGKSSLWEELDCGCLADDERGDRMSLLLGGVAGGVALPNLPQAGLISSAGQGTLFISNVDKLSRRAQHVLCSIIQAGRYYTVGEAFPKRVECRIILATHQPLAKFKSVEPLCQELAKTSGLVELSAEEVIRVLEGRSDFFRTHPSTLAKAS